jgi:hypothetical protein
VSASTSASTNCAPAAAALSQTPAAQISELLVAEMLDDQHHQDDLSVLAARYLATARPSDQAEIDIISLTDSATDTEHPRRPQSDDTTPQHATFISRRPHPTARGRLSLTTARQRSPLHRPGNSRLSAA